jgi:acetoin utilization deacetylase AcuC-like enzyme
MKLTTHAFLRTVQYILHETNVPTVLLGGGGYHPPSSAKHFTVLTAGVLGREIAAEIPLEAEYWEELERDGGLHVGKESCEMGLKEEEEVAELYDSFYKKVKSRS